MDSHDKAEDDPEQKVSTKELAHYYSQK